MQICDQHRWLKFKAPCYLPPKLITSTVSKNTVIKKPTWFAWMCDFQGISSIVDNRIALGKIQQIAHNLVSEMCLVCRHQDPEENFQAARSVDGQRVQEASVLRRASWRVLDALIFVRLWPKEVFAKTIKDRHRFHFPHQQRKTLKQALLERRSQRAFLPLQLSPTARTFVLGRRTLLPEVELCRWRSHAHASSQCLSVHHFETINVCRVSPCHRCSSRSSKRRGLSSTLKRLATGTCT